MDLTRPFPLLYEQRKEVENEEAEKEEKRRQAELTKAKTQNTMMRSLSRPTSRGGADAKSNSSSRSPLSTKT